MNFYPDNITLDHLVMFSGGNVTTSIFYSVRNSYSINRAKVVSMVGKRKCQSNKSGQKV